MEPELGSVFDGRYVVRRVVAEAEHGAVYAADHRFMERTVAIHLAAKDADASERLEREARLLDRARGPRVLSLLDVGEAGEGRRFLISEPVLGRSLDGVLAVRGALTRPEVIALGLDIAQALEAAHEVGVVHQGLSPASILCVDAPAANTVARLLDFGVWPSPLGMFGGSLGAMAYAAPERFLREQPDAASDIHALGAILYETAVGELPPRDQRTESALRKSLDADLAQVIARALDEVDRRYRSMAEIIEALEVAGATGSVVTSKVVTISSVPPPHRPSYTLFI